MLLVFVIFIKFKVPRDRLGTEEKYDHSLSKTPSRSTTEERSAERLGLTEAIPKETAEPMVEDTVEPKAEEIECPACGMTFMVEIKDLPTEIKCPYCGVTGALD